MEKTGEVKVGVTPPEENAVKEASADNLVQHPTTRLAEHVEKKSKKTDANPV